LKKVLEKIFIVLGLLFSSQIVNAQTIVDTTAQNKKVVLEVYRGALTPFGGFADHVADTLRDKDSTLFTIINTYEGFYAGPRTSGPYYYPDYRSSFGPAIQTQAGIQGWPSGSVNRSLIPSLNVTARTAMSRGLWEDARDTILNQPSPVNVGVTASYNGQTKTITAMVEVYFTDTLADSTFVNVGFKQDNIIGPQNGNISNYPARYGANIGIYTHNDVLRHLVTGQWGEHLDSIVYKKGTLWTRTYTWTVPDSVGEVPIVPADLEVFAFVSGSRDSIYTGEDNPVNITRTPLSGPYTIGGTTPDYVTISAAVSDLNSRGVDSSVIFNIRSGTYTEQIEIDSIIGASATNTITFRKDPSATTNPILTFASSSAASPATVEFDGADYVNFLNLDIKATGSYANVLIYKGNTDYVVIDSCLIEGRSGFSGNQYNTVYHQAGDANMANYCVIKNSEIKNGYFGFYLEGTSFLNLEKGNMLLNTVVTNPRIFGLRVLFQDSLFIEGNEINFSFSSVFSQIGYSATSLKYVELNDNIVRLNTQGQALGFNANSNGSASQKAIISNNVIFNQATSTNREKGIQFTGNHTNIYYNTIRVTSSDTTFGIPMDILGINTGDLHNNLFVNTGGGKAIVLAGTGATLTSNHNNFYSSGAVLASFNSGSISNIADWKTSSGKDANSTSLNPLFIASDTLIPYNGVMNNAGTPISGITTDINGTTRNASTPDIGAYEFDPIVFDVTIDSISVDTLCSGTQQVKAYFRNTSDSVIKKIAINIGAVNLTNASEQDSVFYYNGSLAKNAIDSAIVGYIDFTANTDFRISVSADTITGSGSRGYLDDDPSNNFIIDTVSVRPNPAANFTIQKACAADSIVLIASGGVDYSWDGPNAFTDTSNVVVRVNPDTANMQGLYTVTVIDSAGCSATYSNSVNLDSAIIIGLPADFSICSSTDTSITANENSQYAYLWNNGETTPTISVDSSFEFVVKVTDQNNCVVYDTFELTVYNDPIVQFDSTIQAACAFGSPILLSHASPRGAGGTYSGFNVSGDTLTPKAFGNYPVKYSYVDSNGCSGFADTSVVIHKRPSVTVSTIGDLCINEAPYTISENSPIDTVYGRFTGTGIVNDSIGIFDPFVADTGTHTITYTYTDSITGCSAFATNTITVNDTFNIQFSAAASYCINNGRITLSKPDNFTAGLNGYYLDTNINNSVTGSYGFNPAIADTGSQTLTYKVTNANNCTSTAYRAIDVKAIPVVELRTDTFCINSLEVVMDGGTPVGGTYYFGKGVLQTGNYNPDSAGVGQDEVHYRYTAGGCSDTAEAVFLVRQIPAVSFTLPLVNTERCIDANSFVLTGQSPITAASAGVGSFGGKGVSGNRFFAGVADTGTHVIQYKYVNQFGCADSTTDEIQVYGLPEPAFTTPFARICKNQIPDSVFATPVGAGGVFSGVGISTSGYFNPSVLSVGANKTLQYTYTDSNGCSDFVIDTFIVDSVPQITLALLPDQCLNGVEYTFTEGKFNTGNYQYKSDTLGLLTAGKYIPSVAGSGIDTITYVYTDALGCMDSLSQTIEVLDTTIVTFTIDTARSRVCNNEPTFNLSSATPIGGVYTGRGLVGNKFTPANAALGNNLITYSYTNSDNCTSKIIDTIVVNSTTPVSFTNQTFCLNDTVATLTSGTPSIGTFKYSGGGMLNNTVFSPAVAGVGPRTMTYSLTNADGCVSQATATFTVNSLPSTQFGAQSAICFNADTFSLTGTSTSGDSSYFYGSTGIVNAISGRYLASLSSVGLDTLSYVGKLTSTGCSDTISKTILVRAIPNTVLDTFPDYCVNNAPIALTKGSPTVGGTGVYSGSGVVGTQFYPSIAKVGSHPVVYRFTDNNNCSVSDTEIVVVNGLPVLTAAVFLDLCQYDTIKTLTGALPVGGFYSGVNVDSATSAFRPDSVGIWSITYNFVDTNGCENKVAQTQRVRALPLTQLNFGNKFCDNAAPMALTGGSPIGSGGVYSGQGVSGSFYDPAKVSSSGDTLVYNFIDGFGCENSDTVFITFDSSAVVTATPVPDICKGTASLDLSTYFSPSGGKFNGANVFGSNFNASFLDTGRFAMSYVFTDSNNCATTAKDTIVIRPLPDFQVSSDTGICLGDKIQLIASGNYSYDWNTGDYLSTIQVSPLRTSNYSVTATNSFNCSSIRNIGVTVFDQITVYTSSIDAACNTANGTAFTSVTGGIKPYNYLWSTGERTSTARQLYAGNYQVTVNDKNGCIQYGVIGVSNEDGPIINVSSLVNNTCAGDESGEIEVSISSNSAYQLFWNNGALGTKLTNLKSGIYELSVIGEDGCSSFKSFEITSPKAYEYQAVIEQPDCDSTNGSIFMKLSNSLDSVSYQWLSQASGDTLKSVGSGTYNVVVTNNKDCMDTVVVALNTAAAPKIKLDSIQFADCSQNNGALTISGIDPISSFNWSNGDTTSSIQNLSIGSYTVTASDVNGCSAIEQYDIEAVLPTMPVICKVTNDSLLSANVLVWDTTGSPADSFYVYRESAVKNQYFKLATIGRNAAPSFVDSALTNSTSIGTYSLVAIDACENESVLSPGHKSILLNTKQTDSTLIELNWSNYQGHSFGDYYIYRYSSQLGLQLLDSMGGINTYIDYNVPYTSSVLYYYIGIKGATNCGDTGITTISNLSRDYGVKLVGVSELPQKEIAFLVWPNPNNGSFQIKLNGIDAGEGQLVVYDAQGKIRYQKGIDSSLQGSMHSIILSNISSGLYYVQFIQNETVITREIVINR
jgi:hypothetical protein